MLSVTGISYYIGKKQILQDISVNFLPGKFNMILGPNGSGKSTFLKIFSGEIHPSHGKVYYGGEDLAGIRKDQLAKYRAVMSQQPELSFPLTVNEVVMMGRYPHFDFKPSRADLHICDEAIHKMQIHDLVERNYLTLSGGEKQRVQFARVLAQIWEVPSEHPRYLFLDEPLASLDIKYQQSFLTVAKELTQTNTVLVAVMHDINLSIQYGDELLFLRDGKVAAHGKPTDILTEDLIRNVFHVDTRIVANPVGGKPLVVYST